MAKLNFLKLQLELAEQESEQLRKHFAESDEDYSWDDIKILFAMYDVRISVLKSRLSECSESPNCIDKRIPYNGC